MSRKETSLNGLASAQFVFGVPFQNRKLIYTWSEDQVAPENNLMSSTQVQYGTFIERFYHYGTTKNFSLIFGS
jgi:hypothetical protein